MRGMRCWGSKWRRKGPGAWKDGGRRHLCVSAGECRCVQVCAGGAGLGPGAPEERPAPREAEAGVRTGNKSAGSSCVIGLSNC